MANPACMSQDGREAVFVGTMLQTGDAFTLCDECLVGWSAALLQSMTGVDPTPFLQAISAGTPEGGDDNPGEDPEHEIGTSDGEPSAPPGSDPSAAAATPAARFLWLAARVLAGVVTVPIAEELAFRGYLARRIMDREFDLVSFTRLSAIAIAASSLVFGLLHAT